MKKTFAFVFARGGSKGLPGKNVLLLGGKPLIAYSIDMAKKIKSVDRLFVSTEDNEIKRIAMEYGAEVIDRPKELASDTAPEIAAWQHAISFLKERGQEFDIFLSLPATSPLRDFSDVNACLKNLDGDTDIVITVTPASRSPYFNMVTRSKDGYSSIVLPVGKYTHRQEVPEVFDVTTVAYVAKTEFILHCKNIFEGSVKSVVIPKERAIDIDDYWDYITGKSIFEIMHNSVEK